MSRLIKENKKRERVKELERGRAEKFKLLTHSKCEKHEKNLSAFKLSILATASARSTRTLNLISILYS